MIFGIIWGIGKRVWGEIMRIETACQFRGYSKEELTEAFIEVCDQENRENGIDDVVEGGERKITEAAIIFLRVQKITLLVLMKIIFEFKPRVVVLIQGVKMDYKQAVEHVKDGGKAWEQGTWGSDSYLYFTYNKLFVHCSEGEFPFNPDVVEKESILWELF